MPANIRAEIGSWRSVLALFAWACRHAINGLGGPDLAALDDHLDHGLPSLGWLPPDRLAELNALFATLSARKDGRWTLNAANRGEVVRICGGEPVVENPRVAFCIANCIDANYGQPQGEAILPEAYRQDGVMRPAFAFLERISNPPPRIGQMTARLVSRRWFSNLWIWPRLERFDGFGPMPEVLSVALPESVLFRLRAARDRREIRLCLVSWRRHGQRDLVLHRARPGCFAIAGVRSAPSPELPSRLVDELVRLQADIALLPEVALAPEDLTALRTALRERGTAFPTIVVAGLVHQPRGEAFANEAVVLDAEGRELFRQKKFEPFTSKHYGLEDIVISEPVPYRYADSPIGRIVVNVCRDIRSDVPMLLNRLLEATVLLVPSYSNDLDFVGGEAQLLGQRQRAIAAAANPTATNVKTLALLYAPLRGRRERSGRHVRKRADPRVGDVVVSSFQIAILPEGEGVLNGPSITTV